MRLVQGLSPQFAHSMSLCKNPMPMTIRRRAAAGDAHDCSARNGRAARALSTKDGLYVYSWTWEGRAWQSDP